MRVYKEDFPSSFFGAAGDAPQGLLSQDFIFRGEQKEATPLQAIESNQRLLIHFSRWRCTLGINKGRFLSPSPLEVLTLRLRLSIE